MIGFIYQLREAGIPVSVQYIIEFYQALQRGLVSAVFPAETLGQHYVVTPPTSPLGNVVGHIVRIFGNVDGTTLTYSPSKPAGCPSTINAGQVAATLDPLLAQLRNALSSPDSGPPAAAATPPPPVDPAQVRTASEQLTKLLSEFDPGAADFVEANQASLRPLFTGNTWPHFEKLVQNYAFADAQAQLEKARKTLPAT